MLFNESNLKNIVLKRWGLDPFNFTHTGPIDLLVLQPTPYCNLACSYCYLTTKDDKSKMTFATLRKALERVFSSGLVKETFTILWHAGEPMVAGLEYYKEAYRIIEEMTPPGIKVTTNFQTNATLVTDDWCVFIKEKQIRIGVSIDGPEVYNDINRKTRTGIGAFKKSKKGMDLLKAHNIPFYTIAVLTDASIDNPDAFYNFYVENEISDVCFNVEEREVANKESSLNIARDRSRFFNFISRFYDLVENGDFKIDVREIRSSRHAILTWTSYARNFNGYSQENWPLQIINVAFNGDFSTYSPEMVGVDTEKWGKFIFGNVHTDDFKDILRNEKFIAVTKEIRKGIKMCKATCSYFDLCGGGTPANKLYENGSFASTETMYCSLHIQTPIDVVFQKLEGKLKNSRLQRQSQS